MADYNVRHSRMAPACRPCVSDLGYLTAHGGHRDDGRGDIRIRTGGNFNTQTGTFGKGDLSVYSGGDLRGRFLVKKGIGELSAMGNFGVPSHQVAGLGVVKEPQLIEASDARISVAAQGNVELGAVLNPNLAVIVPSEYWDNQYTQNSSVKITAVTGDVNLYGSVDVNRYRNFYGATESRNLILPPSVDISAGKNINVMAGSGEYVLLPSPTGSLAYFCAE